MSEHPNAALIRSALDAMNSGDMQALANAMSDDLVWHEIGATEPVHGKAALAARFAEGGPNFEITAELHDVVANDDHAIAMVRATAKRDGKTFTYRTAEIFHIKDGKITERWAFSDDTGAINKFFG
jgi:hypothetical protein